MSILLSNLILSTAINDDIVLLTHSPVIDRDGHLVSGNNKYSGPSTHGKNFLRFLWAIRCVPTSDGFRFVGQYRQLSTHKDSHIPTRRELMQTQNLRELLCIKCKVTSESDQYMTCSYLLLLSCNTEHAIRVTSAAATNSNHRIVSVPLTGHTLHFPNKNTTDIVSTL